MLNRIEQDVMAHFALRGARRGSAFDPKGFRRLTIAKYAFADSDLESALHHLAAVGYVELRGPGYLLTSQGETYLYGVTADLFWHPQ